MRNYKYKYLLLSEILFIPLNTNSQVIKNKFGYNTNKVKQIIDFILAFFKFLKTNKVRQSEINKNSYLFYCLSQNNYNSLLPVYNNIQGDKFFIRLGSTNQYKNFKIHSINQKLSFIEIVSCLIDTLVLYTFYKNLRNLLNPLFKSIIALKQSQKAISLYKPKAIFFANDHNFWPRSVLIEARNKNVPTIYLQHACVTSLFPPLGFNLALLDGQDAYDKYKSLSNVKCTIKKVGLVKFDNYKKLRNYSSTISNVGICINGLDDEKSVLNLLLLIQNKFNDIKISVRFHPNYSVKTSILTDLKNINYSNRSENSFKFLSKQDLIISGNSSIHLEAVLLNVISLQFNFDSEYEIADHYGFEKNNLIIKCNSSNEIINVIKKYKDFRPENWYKRAKYYVENLEDDVNALDNIFDTLQQNRIIR